MLGVCSKCCTSHCHSLLSVDWLYCAPASGPKLGSITRSTTENLSIGETEASREPVRGEEPSLRNSRISVKMNMCAQSTSWYQDTDTNVDTHHTYIQPHTHAVMCRDTITQAQQRRLHANTHWCTDTHAHTDISTHLTQQLGHNTQSQHTCTHRHIHPQTRRHRIGQNTHANTHTCHIVTTQSHSYNTQSHTKPHSHNTHHTDTVTQSQHTCHTNTSTHRHADTK